MSEPNDHFNLESRWPPWKAEPSDKQGNARLTLRLAFLIAIVALIGANFWLRMPHAPISEPPGGEHIARAKPLPLDQLKTTAIAEVQKRNGWSGQAELREQEGNAYYFVVKCVSKQRTTYVRVELDCFTGRVLDYRVL